LEVTSCGFASNVEFVRGNIFESGCDVLVNPVNCMGVMGAGLALQVKQAFPDVFKAYRKACLAGKLKPGLMHVTQTGRESPRYVINFPTKRHWREASRIEDIESGLEELVETLLKLRGAKTVAVPALGCGLGGLAWPDVKRLIEAAFDVVPGIKVRCYEPETRYVSIAEQKGHA
jgi:O-acetyl-ADP-ribose deacetylase (regulator of RNase III)